jgi:hypothetical protein
MALDAHPTPASGQSNLQKLYNLQLWRQTRFTFIPYLLPKPMQEVGRCAHPKDAAQPTKTKTTYGGK